MFCLRNWIALLVFLYVLVPVYENMLRESDYETRTNASPIYVFLFLTATYALQRPCVYCSILLFVLIFSLFDFNANWFEPRWKPPASITETAGSLLSGNATLAEALGETASIAISAINGTGGSLASAAMESVKRRAAGGNDGAQVSGSGFEWLRSLIEKRQFRIPCVDVIVRL